MSEEQKKARTRLELLMEIKALKEELEDLKENNLILPLRYYIDEETEKRVIDTDEMESEFHDALVDLGAYGEECEEIWEGTGICSKCEKPLYDILQKAGTENCSCKD